MKFVIILQDFRHNGNYYEGERRKVSEADAGFFCGVGWAKDEEGKLETGEPDLSEKKLVVDNGKHVASSKFSGVN